MQVIDTKPALLRIYLSDIFFNHAPSYIVYTFTGYNSAYNNRFIKLYNDSDSEIAGFVRDMRLLPQNFNVDKNTLDSIIVSVCCT